MRLTDQSESQALILEESRKRGRGQGRGYHKDTEKGWWRSQARGRTIRCFYCDQEGHIKRDCPKYKAPDQSSVTAATIVMSVGEDEIDILLAALEDGKSDWVLDLDSKGCSFDASGETLRVSKGNKEILWGEKTGGLCRLEGSVQIGGVIVRHRIRSGARAQEAALGYVRKSGQTRVVQPMQDVYREVQRKDTKSILRSCIAKGAATPKRISFALDLISGGDLSSCAHKGGEMEPRQLAKSYRGTGSEAVKKDNLKISDYPPVGWRGRLLSPTHLDESKSSSQVQARLEFTWSVHVTVKLSSYLELFESLYLFVFLVRLG
ncbi:hypothetical protein Acr_00g0093400 [Actinidia rufa]|uniref:CCHC-type domain-containing protein n=1 Tax=Actinidia rufa TaxID=165716 RepID=A0A7J0DXS0_9ERIC|nr:hypothetical protein Acr_00g0093400 [Actinidia rufa]